MTDRIYGQEHFDDHEARAMTTERAAGLREALREAHAELEDAREWLASRGKAPEVQERLISARDALAPFLAPDRTLCTCGSSVLSENWLNHLERQSNGPHRALLAAPAAVDASVIEDAARWRAAEAEGHIVDFSETGFGLQHPPSCRPNLLGCWFNVYLSGLGYPDEGPGRYRMTRQTGGVVEYARLPEPATFDAEDDPGETP